MGLRKIIIAIDGYSACGKSTTAKQVAGALGYTYIDTGAMYRSVTYYFLQQYVSLTNPKEIAHALGQIKINFHINSENVSETFLNGMNVEKEIRKMKVSEHVSQISTLKEVRNAMVSQQRKLGKDKGVVMDGRDIGTVVFPNADLKLFMNADIHVRAARRQKEFLDKGKLIALHEVLENIRMRDEIDTTRSESPLLKASDAIEINTTHVTVDEQVEEVIRHCVSRILKANNYTG
jgi:CMP/dCMP kinase